MHVPLPVADVARCRHDAAFLAEVAACFRELDEEITRHNPPCSNRGACCKFTTFGHDLFVTAVELAYFLARSAPPLRAPSDRSFCPYQQGGLCTAREARPAGCRIFFCDPGAQEWQPDLTERTLRRLRAIGTRYNLPEAYVEWTGALRDLGGAFVERPSEMPNTALFDSPSAGS